MRLFLMAQLVLALLAWAPAGLAKTPDQTLQQTLDRALEDERRSQQLYRLVLERHGELRPFSRIVEAEGRHQQHLLELYAQLGLSAPEPGSYPDLEAPGSLLEACREAVSSERQNVALYDELLEQVEDPRVREVFGWLRGASLERHLPAFERCVTRGGQGGGAAAGPGRGRGGPHAGRGHGAGGGCGGCGGCGCSR